jgi:hypothetical protein
LTVLYRATDRRSRDGLPVESLADSAFFHSRVKNAPSKPGTIHGKLRDECLNEEVFATLDHGHSVKRIRYLTPHCLTRNLTGALPVASADAPGWGSPAGTSTRRVSMATSGVTFAIAR